MLNGTFIVTVSSNSDFSYFKVSVYSVSPKNETCIILNILYSCKSIAMKFSTWYPDGLSY